MSRISQCFKALNEKSRPAFVAYLCAGDPDWDTSLNACLALIDSGVDILELGVPFSDPLADGLTNQLAAQRALDSGMTHARVFELVRRIRETSDIPIVFYTYFNLVHSQGLEAYVEQAKEAGVDGMLVLDLPPEEASELEEIQRKHGLDSIYIVAPTTLESRIAGITSRASGFIYYVSREGVTGERANLATDLEGAVERIRRHTELPVVVGFGISTPDHVKAVGEIADGVVVGSALVRCLETHVGDSEQAVRTLREKADWLIQGIST